MADFVFNALVISSVKYYCIFKLLKFNAKYAPTPILLRLKSDSSPSFVRLRSNKTRCRYDVDIIMSCTTYFVVSRYFFIFAAKWK